MNAINDFNVCIANNSKNGQAYFFRGLARIDAGDYKNSKKDLKQAIRLGVIATQSYWGIGTCYYNMANQSLRGNKVAHGFFSSYRNRRNFHKAIKWFDKSIEMNPYLAMSYNSRGASKQGLGKMTDAILDYNKTIELDSTFALAYNNRGAARYYNQNVAEPSKADILLAIEDFRLALKFDPSMVLPERNIGFAFSLIEEYDSAMIHIERAIRLNNNDAFCYLNRARIKYAYADYQGAVDDFMKALQRDPFNPDAYIEMGNAKSKLGYYENAIDDQIEAIKLNRRFANVAYYNIACSYSLMGDKDLMYKYLNKAKRKNYFTRDGFKVFLEDPDFENFRKDQEFIEYTQKLRKKAN